MGGLIGAGIALLMAPQSGKKTRSMIADKGMEIRDRAVDTAEDTRDRASKAIDNLTETTRKRATKISRRSSKMMADMQKSNPVKEKIQAYVCD